MSLPIGEDTESFDVTVLIEIRGVTTGCGWWNDGTVIQVESGELATFVVVVVELEIWVLGEAPRRVRRQLPDGLVFAQGEWSGDVQVSREVVVSFLFSRPAESDLLVETDHITHRSYSQIRDIVHALGMQSVDEISPILQSTEMGVQKSEIQCRVT